MDFGSQNTLSQQSMNGTPSNQAALLGSISDYRVPTQEIHIPVPAQDDRRAAARHQCSIPLVVIPVGDDLRPGSVHWADATTVDVSLSGLGFIHNSATPINSSRIVVGAEVASGRRAFATVQIESQASLEDGRHRIGGSWQIGTDKDFLGADRLTPRIDGQTLTFKYGWPRPLLDAWSEVGVLRQYLIDRILVCGTCGAMPSFRFGCNTCGSGRIHRDQVIESETNEPMTRYECFDCGSRGLDPKISALCHLCNQRFDQENADEQVLYAYHVDRLDPLAMIRE